MTKLRPTLDPKTRRHAALGAIPRPTVAVRKEEKGEKLYVTILYERPRWQRLLGASETAERTFGLDTYGRWVYEHCDGKAPVHRIIDGFAKDTQISKPEAELAVTKFMRTLMVKGLVVMEMEKPK